MSFHVRPTARAEADIERFYQDLAQRRGEAVARRWYESYMRAVERLRTFPRACGLAYENPIFAEELRHLLFGIQPKRRYRALFVVRGDEVVILAVGAPGERPVQPGDVQSNG